MTQLEELHAYALRKLGKLDGVTPYPAETLAWLQGRVPDSMIDMLKTLGIGTWGKGKWQTVDGQKYAGILRQTLRGDPDFSADDCTAFAICGFGDLICWHRTHGTISLNVLPNTLSAAQFFDQDSDGPDLLAMSYFSAVSMAMGEYYDKYAADGKGMFNRLIAAHGPLAPGQIFAPRLHPAIGGAMTVENFRPVSAPEATALLHQMEPFILVDNRKPREVKVRMIGRQ